MSDLKITFDLAIYWSGDHDKVVKIKIFLRSVISEIQEFAIKNLANADLLKAVLIIIYLVSKLSQIVPFSLKIVQNSYKVLSGYLCT